MKQDLLMPRFHLWSWKAASNSKTSCSVVGYVQTSSFNDFQQIRVASNVIPRASTSKLQIAGGREVGAKEGSAKGGWTKMMLFLRAKARCTNKSIRGSMRPSGMRSFPTLKHTIAIAGPLAVVSLNLGEKWTGQVTTNHSSCDHYCVGDIRNCPTFPF